MENDALGRPIDEFIPFDKAVYDFTKQTRTAAISDPKQEGGKIECDIHLCPIVNQKNQKLGVAILVSKTSPRSQLEADLKLQVKKLQEMYRFAPIGIFQVDVQGEIISANSELAWMLGYESSEKLVRQISDFADQVFYDETRAEEFIAGLFEMEKVDKFRCRLKRKGHPDNIWALCFARITYDNTGRKNGFNGYAVDIRETVRAEQQLKKANEKLTALSVLDGLTKIPNRRKFDMSMDEEWQRHIRDKKELSLILCDIDYFKKYNDTYGHQAGDDCLVEVAGAIKKSVQRSSDTAARYGGEEFAVILPGTGSEGAKIIAEKIRISVQQLGIVHESSGISPHVSLSLGVSTLIPEKSGSNTQLIKMADEALYRAKESGRNQFVVY